MKTIFNPENKEVLTYGECLSPAMNIKKKNDAKQYLSEYIKYIQKHLDKDPREDNKTAEEIAKSNLGYFAGYYDNDTRARVEELFECSHPIFGGIKENGPPSAEKAFEMGKKLGEKTLRKKKIKKIFKEE